MDDKYVAEPIKDKPKQAVGRLTVAGGVYHQLDGLDALLIGKPYQRLLTVNEDVYTRRIKVDKEWQDLDLAWVTDNLGMIVIDNIGAPKPKHNPDPATIPSRESLALHLRYEGDLGYWVIPIKEWDRFTPGKCIDLYPIQVRCLGGPSYAIIHALPR